MSAERVGVTASSARDGRVVAEVWIDGDQISGTGDSTFQVRAAKGMLAFDDPTMALRYAFDGSHFLRLDWHLPDGAVQGG